MNPNEFTPVDAPPDRPAMAYGALQVAALVIVTADKEITSVPPHTAAAVVLQDNPSAVVSVVGPITDLASVQDAVVFAQAYALRAALRKLVEKARDMVDGEVSERYDDLRAAVEEAQKTLDRATPQFASMKPPSAEQRLAAAREGYDASQNPDTTGILRSDVEIADQSQAGQPVSTHVGTADTPNVH